METMHKNINFHHWQILFKVFELFEMLEKWTEMHYKSSKVYQPDIRYQKY